MKCLFLYKSKSLLITFLLISSFTRYSLIAEGRDISKLIQGSQSEEFGAEEMVRMTSLIGSRPPKCQGKCYSCGRECVAVQVPVINKKFESKSQDSKIITAKMSLAYSRGDYITNYKPMCWKCKCGDLFFNP